MTGGKGESGIKSNKVCVWGGGWDGWVKHRDWSVSHVKPKISVTHFFAVPDCKNHAYWVPVLSRQHSSEYEQHPLLMVSDVMPRWAVMYVECCSRSRRVSGLKLDKWSQELAKQLPERNMAKFIVLKLWESSGNYECVDLILNPLSMDTSPRLMWSFGPGGGTEGIVMGLTKSLELK